MHALVYNPLDGRLKQLDLDMRRCRVVHGIVHDIVHGIVHAELNGIDSAWYRALHRALRGALHGVCLLVHYSSSRSHDMCLGIGQKCKHTMTSSRRE